MMWSSVGEDSRGDLNCLHGWTLSFMNGIAMGAAEFNCTLVIMGKFCSDEKWLQTPEASALCPGLEGALAFGAYYNVPAPNPFILLCFS